MLELEDRIRTEVNRQAEGYVPADDLPARIAARVRHRRVVRRSTVVAAAAAAVVVAVVAAGLLVRPTEDAVMTDTPPESTPSTTEASTTSTTGTTGTSTSTTDGDARTSTPPTSTADPGVTTPVAPPPVDSTQPDAPTGASVGQGMPLHRRGVAGIVAGMTLREAVEATGNTITPGEPIGPTSTCNTAVVEGTGMTLMVTTTGDPDADPMDGVIQQVVGGQSTVEGIRVGDTADAVHALYGPPTDTMTPFGNTYEVFEEGGFAYVVVLAPDGTVVELESGYPTVYPEGCA